VLAIVHSSCALITVIFPKTAMAIDTGEPLKLNVTEKA
jgi:hypothetical protein